MLVAENVNTICDISQVPARQGPVDLGALKRMVSMDAVLDSLGIPVRTKSHRAPCPIHGGKNPSAFSWTDTGAWHCHSCGAGGDSIELIRKVRGLTFRDAVKFLADIAGVTVAREKLDAPGLEKRKKLKKDAWGAALDYYRAIVILRSEPADRLQRCERLTVECRDRLNAEKNPEKQEFYWTVLGTLEPMLTESEAEHDFLGSASADDLITFLLATSSERREIVSLGSAA